jgi:FkbM family methyltransferase
MSLESIKKCIKKYAPRGLYFFLYRVFKYWQVLVLRRDDTQLTLTQFTKPQFRDLRYDNVHFSILLDPDNGSVDKEIFTHGTWEPDTLSIMRTYIGADSVCVDAGANIGHHTLYMARRAHTGAVHAFEPLSKLCDQIEESVRKNALSNVQVHQYGLSDADAVHDIHINLLNIGKTTLDAREGLGRTERVSVKRFDDVWDPHIRVSFVKIDVEGHEYKTLRGMAEMLRRDHPVLLFEYSPVFYRDNDTDCHAMLTFVLALGYRIFDIEANHTEVTRNALDTFIATCTFQTNLLCLPSHTYAAKN